MLCVLPYVPCSLFRLGRQCETFIFEATKSKPANHEHAIVAREANDANC